MTVEFIGRFMTAVAVATFLILLGCLAIPWIVFALDRYDKWNPIRLIGVYWDWCGRVQEKM